MTSIRVVIQQPALTKYRIPVFRELARRPGIDLLVAYGDEKGIANAQPEGFAAELVPLHDYHLPGAVVRWHSAQWRYGTKARADVVVMSWSTRYLSLLPGIFRAKWNGLGTVLWGHGYSKAETRLRQRVRQAVSDLGDALLFYNNTAAQRYIDDGYSQAERIFVALNTLDQGGIRAAADSWRNDPARLDAFRRDQGIAGRPIVLFVSRLLEGNRTDLLVAAMPDLLRQFPDLLAVVIGDGPAGPALRAQARSLGVEHAVRFLGAVYGEEQLAPWFLSSKVFCYPANIGLSIIHAMIYGLPVITSSKVEAQNPEIEAFRDGVNGLYCVEGDAASLTSSLRTILADPALQARLAAGAADTVTDDFTVARMVDGMESAIRYAAACRGLFTDSRLSPAGA